MGFSKTTGQVAVALRGTKARANEGRIELYTGTYGTRICTAPPVCGNRNSSHFHPRAGLSLRRIERSYQPRCSGRFVPNAVGKANSFAETLLKHNTDFSTSAVGPIPLAVERLLLRQAISWF
jgi:hypothetical protein